MKLVKSKNCNVNYLAKVVDIKVFRKHSNPEVTKLKCCTIDGFNIITSIDAEPGLYIYFPTACCINPDLLSYNNLFRKSEKNSSPDKTVVRLTEDQITNTFWHELIHCFQFYFDNSYSEAQSQVYANFMCEYFKSIVSDDEFA